MEKVHFVLVHGICHGAWCWYKIVTKLKSVGHHVTALDLGASGVNSKRFNEIASISDYVNPLTEFLVSLPEQEKVILVGHSYGGIGISLAMEAFPKRILAAVYVTAFIPNCTSPPATLVQEFFKRNPVESLLDCQFSPDEDPENSPSVAMFGPKCLAANIYQRCREEDLELAKMLVRPSGLFLKDLGKESLLTEEKFGSVQKVYIMCEKDELLKKDFQDWLIENSRTKDVRSITGADHMVMLSKPEELCRCFQEIAEKYN